MSESTPTENLNDPDDPDGPGWRTLGEREVLQPGDMWRDLEGNWRKTNYGNEYDGMWERYSVAPAAHWGEHGAVRHGNVITFPKLPEVKGEVFLGPRPEGNYVLEENIGINYTQKQYIGISSTE